MVLNYGTFNITTCSYFPPSTKVVDIINTDIKHFRLKCLIELRVCLDEDLIRTAATVVIQTMIRARTAKKRYKMKKIKKLFSQKEDAFAAALATELEYANYVCDLSKSGGISVGSTKGGVKRKSNCCRIGVIVTLMCLLYPFIL